MAIEFKYVYKVEVDPPQEGLIELDLEKPKPVGPGHIFKTYINGDLGSLAMCGIKDTDIGEKLSIRKNNVRGIKICPECLEKWKEDSRSQYAKWVNGKSLR